MSLEPKKIAFIGGGVNSAVGYAHFCASRIDGHFELFAGAFSRNTDINQKSAARYGVKSEHTYDCWRKLIQKERETIDAVVILTPTPTHQEIVEQCIENSLPVICEKAIAHDWHSCKAIEKKVKDKDSFLAVTFNYSGYPLVREIRSMISAGRLGKIFSINVDMPQEGFARLVGNRNKPEPQEWRLKDGEIPTIYLDLAVHMHHLIDYTTGLKPVEVIANEASYGWFEQVVDHVSALIKYQRNVSCQFTFSKSTMGHRNGLKLQIYGEKGSVIWEQKNPEEMLFCSVDGSRQIIERGGIGGEIEALRYNRFKAGHPSGFIEAFGNIYEDFYLALNKREQQKILESYGIEVAVEGMALIKAMTKSYTTKKWEKV